MRDIGRGKDNHGRPYIPGMNCDECGRFVGKDGDCDISYDFDSDGYEIGYPTCAKCLSRQSGSEWGTE
ncbi:MAG: hypothetical protein PHT07_23065 [Paludibacter sp.]|nr:hypothetical protein [Paludibacter sp.]